MLVALPLSVDRSQIVAERLVPPFPRDQATKVLVRKWRGDLTQVSAPFTLSRLFAEPSRRHSAVPPVSSDRASHPSPGEIRHGRAGRTPRPLRCEGRWSFAPTTARWS